MAGHKILDKIKEILAGRNGIISYSILMKTRGNFDMNGKKVTSTNEKKLIQQLNIDLKRGKALFHIYVNTGSDDTKFVYGFIMLNGQIYNLKGSEIKRFDSFFRKEHVTCSCCIGKEMKIEYVDLQQDETNSAEDKYNFIQLMERIETDIDKVKAKNHMYALGEKKGIISVIDLTELMSELYYF